MNQRTITTNWPRITLSRRQTRVERRDSPQPIPGVLTTLPGPRLASPVRPHAAIGEVVNGHIRCGACGRKRDELIRTLRQFQCVRCVTHNERMGESQS